MTVIEGKRVGPFMGVQKDQVITFGKRKFRVVLYAAYNAFGLIGSERNGVAVLDENKRAVLLDGEAQIDSGYFGASGAQFKRFDEVVAMSWGDFRAWVNQHPSKRFDI